MKSPLVDALRNATGRTGEETPAADTDAPPVTDDLAEVGPKRVLLDELGPDADELSLLEATIDGRVIRQPENDSAPGTATPEAVDAESRAGQESSRVSAATLARNAVRTRRLTIERAGRFSPLICLLLGMSSTGAYLLYQDVSSGEANASLATLPAKPGTEAGRGAAGIPEPQGPLERFSLLESGGRRAASGAMPAPTSRGTGEGNAGPSAVAELLPQPGNGADRP